MHSEAGPASKARCIQAELIENSAHDVMDQLVYILRVVVEGWNRREDDRAHAAQGEHIFQMNLAERAFTRKQHQLAALFQMNVGSAANVVISETCTYRGKRPHTTRRDDHAIGLKGSARDRCCLVIG